MGARRWNRLTLVRRNSANAANPHLGVSNSQDRVGSARDVRSVGDADARYIETPQALADVAFLFNVEMARSLVQQQNLRLPVEPPRQHTPLLFPPPPPPPHL